MRQAAEGCLSRGDPEFLQYGANQGDGTFRQSLAGFLSRGYGWPTRSDSLFITSGASMGLHLICTLFTKPGDTIFVEEPTYFFALRIFADHDLRLIPIRTDEEGLVVEDLEEKLVNFRPKFLYIIPTFQNPTGHSLPVERRQNLVNLSTKHDFLVVADEVYHFLSYSKKPPIPFAAFIESGNIISLGSFSKILAPGLRLGWMQANSEIIQRFVNCGLINSGGGMNPFTSAIVCQILENGGLEQNISKLITTYGERCSAMDTALRQHLPGIEYTRPEGGYFFWIRLPSAIDAGRLQHQAKDLMVGFRPGTLFSCQGGMQDHIRLSFVFYEPDDLEKGILRIRQSLNNFN
jgi:2-aminoadipate transaminase